MKNLKKILSIIIVLGLFTAITGCSSTSTNESTGQYLDNSVITAKVKTEIIKEDSLKVMQIDVESFKGVVQLSGFVDSKQSSMLAQQIAEAVEGVISVKNNLVVK